MRAWVSLVLLLAGVTGLLSCGKPVAVTPKTWPSPMKVVVSIPPLKGLIEPLLPPGSTVTVLIPPGVSEHGYEIPPTQLREAISADLLVWIGGMEPSVDTLSKANPRQGRVDIRLADALGIQVHDDEHEHGSAAEHEHEHAGSGDPHFWLDPAQATGIVRAAEKAIVRLRPAPSGGTPNEPADAAAKLIVLLDQLDSDYRRTLADGKTHTIVVAHDAYGWLTKRYNLKTVAISGLTASEPSPGDLQRAKEAVRANGLKAVFTEPQISDRAARSIAEATGAKVLTLDPLGDGDYFKMMQANLLAIRAALGNEPDATTK